MGWTIPSLDAYTRTERRVTESCMSPVGFCATRTFNILADANLFKVEYLGLLFILEVVDQAMHYRTMNKS